MLGKQQGEARLSQFVGSAYNENAQAEVVHINAPLTKEQYTDTAKVRDEILSPLIGVEVQIDSDGRLVSFDKQGIKDALKKRNLHRTILGEIEKIVQKSFYFDYETSDGKAKHANVLGQFTYVVPVEMNGTVYRAEIKVDRMRDTPAGKGDFKQQSVFKVADVALSTGLDTRQSRSEEGASSTTSASVRLGDLMEGRKPKTQRVLFSFIGEVGAKSFGKNSVVLRSLKRAKKMFEAGKYENEIWETTGWRLAERVSTQDALGTDKVRFSYELKNPDGTVFGWYNSSTGEIWLNEDAIDFDTPIHEFTHAWSDIVEREDPRFFYPRK